MEVIDIGVTDIEPVRLTLDETPQQQASSTLGIELLMNDKKRSAAMSVDLGDVDTLERELNDLSSSSATKSVSGLSNFFNFGGAPSPSPPPPPPPTTPTDSKVGTATVEAMGNTTKTWDGFGKMSDVPVDKPKLTEREMRRKKRAMIKKLDEWYDKKFIKNNSHFTMESPYEDIEDEYEAVVEEKRKKDSVKLQGWWFTTIVNSVEYANAMFDPFGLNLDGWGEQISEDLDSYEDIFNELHDKYKGGKLSPEISLLLRVAFSASMVNITNKALSTATPGFNDVIRQSPELMKMFTTATAQSMKQSSPGFGFVNSILNPEEATTSFGAPPAPLETKSMPPVPRPGNRPDLALGRGGVFREEEPAVAARPDMRGPQSVDLQSLLGGLKSRNDTDDDSIMSVASLSQQQNSTLPKRTHRRKQRSEGRNVVSLDI